MTQHGTTNQFKKGSSLIMALVVIGIGSLAIIAGLNLIGARSHEAEQRLVQTNRLVKGANSRALASRAVSSAIASDTGFTGGTYSLGGDWGEIIIPPITGDIFQLTNNFTETVIGDRVEYSFVEYINTTSAPTSNGNWLDVTQVYLADSISTSISSSASHSSSFASVSSSSSQATPTTQSTIEVHSYSPILNGNLLNIQPMDSSESFNIDGDLKVRGNAVFWPPRGIGHYTGGKIDIDAESYEV
ncbi:MAG: hypothetical protein AAF226_19250, partial [Verrucomicrobiota bacterium]